MTAIGSRLLILTACLLASVTVAAAAEDTASRPVRSMDSMLQGQVLYQRHCASCHNTPQGRTPGRAALGQLSADHIFAALTTGVMQNQGNSLSEVERWLVATMLPKAPPLPSPDPGANLCRESPRAVRAGAGDWAGWAADVENTRFQASPGFTAADAPRLRLKWSFAYPGGAIASLPVVVDGRVFTMAPTGLVLALDASTGCTHWTADLGGSVRAAALAVGSLAPEQSATAFAVNEQGVVGAFEATTGKELWRLRILEQPQEQIVGSPTLHGRVLYVPFGGTEEVAAMDPAYECCRTRGGIVAIDAAGGRVLWRAFTIAEPARPIGRSAAGTVQHGPAGASVWSRPTIDAARRLLYVGTGDDFAAPGSDASDAIVAFDMDSGARQWVRQVLAPDIWLAGCDGQPHANCPERLGPDADFGMPPILARLSATRSMLVAGSKGGMLFGFDPEESGKIVWRTKLAESVDSFGALLYGAAYDGRAVYVPIARGKVHGGLVAVDPASGRVLWRAPPITVACGWGSDFCSPSQAVAVTAIPGAVFSGSADGHIRAYDSRTGQVIWDFDTGRSFDAVNGVVARGGSLGRSGQTVAGGALYVNAGGGYGMGGNALLAFTVDGK